MKQQKLLSPLIHGTEKAEACAESISWYLAMQTGKPFVMTRTEPWRSFRATCGTLSVLPAENRWFAVQVKPRHDKAAAELLEQKGIPVFLPLYACKRRWSDRIQTVQMPLFPGYIFAQLDPCRRTQLLTTAGVVRLVGAGQNPIPIPEGELAAIDSAVHSGARCEPFRPLEIGDHVRILAGPLQGLEGPLVKIKDKNKLILSVSLLGRSIVVEIPSDWMLQRVSK